MIKYIFLTSLFLIKISLAEELSSNTNPPKLPNPSDFNNSKSTTGKSKPIFTLTDPDKAALEELSKFIEDLDPDILKKIEKFEEKMQVLRAESQAAYDELPHEAKLALKAKKDKIENLSPDAKKVYFKNK